MELMELLKTRRTYRRFAQKEISQEIVGEILEAARLASSAANKQPLSYIVVNKPEDVKRYFPIPNGAVHCRRDRDSLSPVKSRFSLSRWWKIWISTEIVIQTPDLLSPT